MDLTADDLDRAVTTWKEARSDRGATPRRSPAVAARRVVHGDLVAAGLLNPARRLPEGLHEALYAVLPRDGREMDRWGPQEWREPLTVARSHAAGEPIVEDDGPDVLRVHVADMVDQPHKDAALALLSLLGLADDLEQGYLAHADGSVLAGEIRERISRNLEG